MMVVLGTFQGGYFLIQEVPRPAPPRKIPTKNRWIIFDGSNEHWAEPVISGTRYSIIAFCFADRDY